MPKIHRTPRKRQSKRPADGMTFQVSTDHINKRVNLFITFDSDDRYQIIEFEARDADALAKMLKWGVSALVNEE